MHKLLHINEIYSAITVANLASFSGDELTREETAWESYEATVARLVFG